MAMLKVILLLLLLSTIFVDARARRRRRQLSSASYYISDVNPYSSSYSPTAPLTYPSGSFYNSPNYGYPGMGVSADQPVYSADQSNIGLNQYSQSYQYNYNDQYPLGSNQVYELPNLGSTYGSGLYGGYGSLSYGYAPVGFNNRYPNWQQGNVVQYFTGGTGSGLILPNYQWYRKFRNVPIQSRSNGNLDQKFMESNLPTTNENLLSSKLRAKRNIR